MNPFSFPLEIWWFLAGLCVGLVLCLIALYAADRYDARQSGDLLAPEDAGASPAARKHSDDQDIDIAAIRERWSKVTAGPWRTEEPWLADVVTSDLLGRVADCSVGIGYRHGSLDDAKAIAAAPTDIANLLVCIDSLEGRKKRPKPALYDQEA